MSVMSSVAYVYVATTHQTRVERSEIHCTCSRHSECHIVFRSDLFWRLIVNHELYRLVVITVRGSDGQYCFSSEFLLFMQDNSRTAALSSMKFCTNIYFHTSTTARILLHFNVIDQRSRSFFVSGPKFTKLLRTKK